MRTLGLLALLCLASAVYIAGFDNVPKGHANSNSASQATGYCDPSAIAGVVNGASDSTTLSPGSIAVIFWCDSTVPLPATPVTSVLVNSWPSYLYPPAATPVTSAVANSPSAYLQLSVQIPVEVSPGSKNLQLKRNNQVVAQTEINLSKFAPGIFTVKGSELSLAIAEHSDGKFVTAACPASPGEAVTIFAEGLGPTTPAVATGALPPGGQLTTTNTLPALTVSGNDANVLFAGLSPDFIGVYQLIFVVPDGSSGQVPLQIQIGQGSSNTAQLPVGPNSCSP
jgi:uncharacterized protein (TIGR03437 family)